MAERLNAAEYKAVFVGRNRTKMPDAVLTAQAAAFDAAAEACLWTQDWARLAMCASAPRSEAHGAMRAVDAEIRVAQLEEALRILDSEAAAAPWWRCSKKRQADDVCESDSGSDRSDASDIPEATDGELEAEERAASQACAVEERAVRELDARRPARMPFYVHSTIIKPKALAAHVRELTGDQDALVTSDALRELILHLTAKVSAVVRDVVAIENATRRPVLPDAPPRRVRMSSVYSALTLHGLNALADVPRSQPSDSCVAHEHRIDSQPIPNVKSLAHAHPSGTLPSGVPAAEPLLLPDYVFDVYEASLFRPPNGTESP